MRDPPLIGVTVAAPPNALLVTGPTPTSTAAARVIAARLADRLGCDVTAAPPPGRVDADLSAASDASSVLCVGLPAAPRAGGGHRNAASRAIGSFAGPVLLVSERCGSGWDPTAGPVLALPATHSSAWGLLGHAAAWSRALDAGLWLATVVDSSKIRAADGDDLLRTELLAAALLGRMSRDLERVGVDAAWDVLYGRSSLGALRSAVGEYPPAIIALEVARPVFADRALWATALAVAHHNRVPVLTLPPSTPPVRPPAPAPVRRAARPSQVAPVSRPFASRPRIVPAPTLQHERVPTDATAPRGGSRARGLAAAIGVIVVLVLVAVSGMQVPYHVLHPGETVDFESIVRVDGAPTYAASGAVRFVTVRAEHATLLDALRGWLHPDVDVVHTDVARADASHVWSVNRDLMDQSKANAAFVALRVLGHDVSERGNGSRVVSLEYDAPASALLQPGDVIVGISSRRADFAEDVATVTRVAAPGDIVAIDYQRQGTGETLSGLIQLDELRDGTVGLGAMLETRALATELPVEIDIPTRDIVGPSAGLAFALGLIEALTPGDLTGELDVAATGAIDTDGVVAVVGGLHQKVVAAAHAGAEVLLVPETQAGDARRYADDDLRVIGVRSLADALVVLDALGGDPVPDLRLPLPRARARHVVAA